MTKFSVIIPAYNCESTIENTVNSIITSGLSDVEIVIIDDGSKDGTGIICDMLSEKYRNIRCIHQENAGVSAARNRGIREADGDYIWFFDADDSVDENALSRAGEIINDIAPDMLIFGIEFDYFHDGKVYRRDKLMPAAEGYKNLEECNEMLYELYASNALSSLCSRIIKRSIVEQAEICLREDMFLYEDLEFSLQVLAQCNEVFFIREAIYKYRQSEDEGSAGRRLKRIPHIPDLLDKISDALANAQDKNRILLSLYLTLAREKIGAASKEEIDVVCADFKSWIDKYGLLPSIADREYAMQIYKGDISKLIFRSKKTKIRHEVANWIKQNIGDFRKW